MRAARYLFYRLAEGLIERFICLATGPLPNFFEDKLPPLANLQFSGKTAPPRLIAAVSIARRLLPSQKKLENNPDAKGESKPARIIAPYSHFEMFGTLPPLAVFRFTRKKPLFVAASMQLHSYTQSRPTISTIETGRRTQKSKAGIAGS